MRSTAGREELVELTAQLVAFDTTARTPDRPASPGGRPAGLSRATAWRRPAPPWTSGSPRPPTSPARGRCRPGSASTAARRWRPASRARAAGEPALQRPHRRRPVGAARPLDERPQPGRGARRQPVRARRLRHEGRRGLHGLRRRGAAPAGRAAARRPDREHGHRRGVLRRRRPGRGAPRRQGRRRHRHRADGVRGVGGVPRVAHPDLHGHRAAPATPRWRSRTGATAAP